jgi:hypothetical protein
MTINCSWIECYLQFLNTYIHTIIYTVPTCVHTLVYMYTYIHNFFKQYLYVCILFYVYIHTYIRTYIHTYKKYFSNFFLPETISQERIADEGRACIIALNKWDAVPKKDDNIYIKAVENIRSNLPALRWAEVIHPSCSSTHASISFY